MPAYPEAAVTAPDEREEAEALVASGPDVDVQAPVTEAPVAALVEGTGTVTEGLAATDAVVENEPCNASFVSPIEDDIEAVHLAAAVIRRVDQWRRFRMEQPSRDKRSRR
jgi:hypothetical protein